MFKKLFLSARAGSAFGGSFAGFVSLAFAIGGSLVFAQELQIQKELSSQEDISLPEQVILQTEEQTREIQLTPEAQLTQSPPEADLMPKADQPMAEALAEIPETQYTQALSFQETPTNYNLLKNSSFESWSEGGDLPPDSWQRSGIKISRNKTTKRFGDYSVKLYKGTGKLSQEIKEMDYFKEEQTPLSFGCWVYSSTPNQVRLSLEDGVNTTYSNYHTGSGEFEFLNLTTTLSDSATNLKVAINLDSKGTVYVDGACVYELFSTNQAFVPNPTDDLKMPSNLIYTDLENQKVGIGVIPDTQEDHRLEVDGNIKASGSILSGDNELLTQISADELYINDQPLTGGETLTGSLNITGNLIVDTYLQTNGNIQAEKFLFSDGTELKSGLWSKTTEDGIYYLGNVGIGTENPETKLYVQDGDLTVNDVSPLIILQNSDDTNGPLSYLQFIDSGDKQIGYVGFGSNDTNFQIKNELEGRVDIGTAGIDRMTIGDSGNVGIGTTNPSNKFHILGSGTIFQLESNTIDSTIKFANTDNSLGFISYDGADFKFYANHGSIPSLTISGGSPGNVGIGTTSPNSLLVVGSGADTAVSAIDGGSSNTVGLSIRNAGTEQWLMRTPGATRLDFDNSLGTAVMTLLQGGNVGIGTVLPAQKLHISDSTKEVAIRIANTGVSGRIWGIFSTGGTSILGQGNLILYDESTGDITGARLVINPSGNVGIGTTNPNYKLDVSGTINATDFYKGGSAFNPSQWTTSGSSDIYYTSGNVGIGTTEPRSQVELYKSIGGSANTGETQLVISNDSGDVLASQAIGFYQTSDDIYTGKIGHLGLAGWDLDLWGYSGINFWTNGQSTATRNMTISADGNVGIGTTSPQGKLEVLTGGNSLFSALRVTHDTAGTNRRAGVSFGLGVGNPVKASVGLLGDGGSLGTGDLIFAIEPTNDTTNVDSNNELMRITKSGNVGIGKTGPSYKLDVAGTINATEFLKGGSALGQWGTSGSNIYYNTGNVGIGTVLPAQKLHISDSTKEVAIRIANTGVSGRIWGIFSTAGTSILGQGNLILYDESTGDITGARLVINPSGNVGIGSTSPSAKLTTSGTTEQLRLEYDPNNYQSFTVGSNGNLYIAQNGAAATLALTNGRVGIGTISPNEKLHVVTNSGGNQLALTDNSADTNLKSWVVGSEGGAMRFIRVDDDWQNNSAERMRITNSGDVYIGTTTPLDTTSKLHVNGSIKISGNINAKYQDVAEWVESEQKLTPGTVVVLDSNGADKVLASNKAYDAKVAGVVSYQPGLLLGEAGEGKYKISHSGRVKTKVSAEFGAIKVGDLLVTSFTPGVAMKSEATTINGREFHQPGTILGKALEPLEEGEKEILVLLSLQ